MTTEGVNRSRLHWRSVDDALVLRVSGCGGTDLLLTEIVGREQCRPHGGVRELSVWAAGLQVQLRLLWTTAVCRGQGFA